MFISTEWDNEQQISGCCYALLNPTTQYTLYSCLDLLMLLNPVYKMYTCCQTQFASDYKVLRYICSYNNIIKVYVVVQMHTLIRVQNTKLNIVVAFYFSIKIVYY